MVVVGGLDFSLLAGLCAVSFQSYVWLRLALFIPDLAEIYWFRFVPTPSSGFRYGRSVPDRFGCFRLSSEVPSTLVRFHAPDSVPTIVCTVFPASLGVWGARVLW